ncbi:MAG: hypothetical protein IJW51_03865 [Clostridia bacterium]|nr:hypothetical protein [Clostridia bacterium]
MGKGNRNKNSQAANVMSGVGNKRSANKKRETPTWVGTLIVVSVLVVVVLFSVFCILNSRGVFLRKQIVAKTENFEVTVPMMSYMVYTEYQEWVNQYSSSGYMQYIKGEGGDGLSTSLPLREQIYSQKTDETTGVTTTVTWFDMFADRAATSVEQILVLCEQAYALGITLSDEEMAAIDSNIQMLELYAAYSGYTTSGYLAAMYGRGVGEKDVRMMLEMAELATKFSTLKSEELKNGATDVRVESYYQENKDKLDIYVDYISYTFTVDFKPVSSSDADATQKNEELYDQFVLDKEKMQVRVDALAACKTSEAFCDLLMRYLQEDGKTATEAFDAQSNAHKINFVKPEDEESELEKWLFGTENPVKAGSTHIIKDEGDDARQDVGDEENPAYDYSETKATYTICYVLRPVHKDDTHLQNVGHILFKTETFKDLKDTSTLSGKTKELAQSLLDKGQTISAENMAKALIELMIAEGKMTTVTDEATGKSYFRIDKDAFKAYGETYTEDSNVFYEDVARGDMVAAFEEWLYDTDRIENEVSAVAVKTTYGYHVMFYDGASEDINWQVAARDAIATADYEAWYKTVSEACKIDVNADNWAKIQ